MGQYHVLVSVEAEELLSPYELGGGLKEAEQGFTRPSTPTAVVALVCARGGNMPADCSQSPIVGKWAGHRVLVQGDYAEDDDIPGWVGPPLSLLYSASGTQQDRDDSIAYRKEQGYDPIDYTGMGIYTEIGVEVAGFIEAACNVRFFGERWKNFVHVKPKGRHFGNCGVGEYVLDESKYESLTDALEYLKRMDMQPIDVQRVPRSGDWHGFLPSEITEGQSRVIVNLDTMEYINPVAFGQVPTLAGMLNAPDERDVPILAQVEPRDRCIVDVPGALFSLLCHPQRRGGGDMPANAKEMGGIDSDRAKYAALFDGAENFKGRWRGGHILGTSEIRYEDWPTTEEVLAKGTDISEMALKYLAAVSHY